MTQLLPKGQKVYTETSRITCIVEAKLGGGGQGEVYRVNMDGKLMALKWYFPHYLLDDPRLRERLTAAINSGPPASNFLWPIELSASVGDPSFGYLMELREPRFKGIQDLMAGPSHADPTFSALATAGAELAHYYHLLHSRGQCYRDISFGNAFFDPKTGEVRICDNDNVDYNGRPGAIGGTPDFMAPEIVRGDAPPSTQTDLFSLSVLLFYMLHIHHPLEGKRMMDIKCKDLLARQKICGFNPVFIFDPADKSNEAVSRAVDPIGESGDNALRYWPLYPQFLRDRFTEAFTVGLHNPAQRITENIWRREMIRLRDSIFYCAYCKAENFYCAAKVKQLGGKPGDCWACKRALTLPPRIRIQKNAVRNVIMLNFNSKLFPYHIDDQSHDPFDFTTPIAEVNQHPTNPALWGLKNLTGESWSFAVTEGATKDIGPGKSVPLAQGTKINFGSAEGEINY